MPQTEKQFRRGFSELKGLRKDFDYLRKEFGGIPKDLDSVRDFMDRLIKIIDQRTERAGIGVFPVIIVDRKAKEKKPIEKVANKGDIEKRVRQFKTKTTARSKKGKASPRS